jgi:hypothetical protein
MARSPVLPSSDANWGLAELVDLEAQLFADRSRSERELVARDAPIGNALRREGRARSALLAGWVSVMRKGPDAPLPGRLVGNAWVQVRWVLAAVFFLVGMGAAAAEVKRLGEDLEHFRGQFDLVLDSSVFGIDGCVELICRALELRGLI